MAATITKDMAPLKTGADYEPGEIESRWQQRWEEEGLYRTPTPGPEHPKWYALTMFPYTSGDLHIGHWYAMAPSDALARFRRMQGYSVLYPMGFDSFGLNGENAAIKHGIDPASWTRDNINRMRGQLKSMGAVYDWSHEFATCVPEYYRWTQWLFTRLHKHGLAYRAKAPANWCSSCNTVLANEQVIEGLCERCDTQVVRQDRWQWLLAISRYAERLLDYSGIEWPAEVQARQRAWIGRSEGARIRFAVSGDRVVEVFTTRPDTLFGVTFLVLAPEHPLVDEITGDDQRAAVAAYRAEARRFSDVERQQTEHAVSGVFTGTYALHPATGEPLPIWIADYVLPHYGGGAVMAVPAHDRRDHRFAQRFNLRIMPVIDGGSAADQGEVFTGDGPLINSAGFAGLSGAEARRAITAYLAERGAGEATVTYRLRDWLVSRQRYWGAPIPIIHCPQCGEVDVPEEDLPVRLPEGVDFRPTGESPLASVAEFVNTACPNCDGPARRETDTLDNFVDSAWYYLRYVSPRYEGGPFDPHKASWLPVDQYSGGLDHATGHLIYVRFFGLAMHDMGITPFAEPIRRLHANGMITVDNRKMSKSRGHMVVPEKYVQEYGADAFRAYLMFIGPWKDGGEWDDSGLIGVRRWLNRVWRMTLAPRQPGGSISAEELGQATAAAVRSATEDLEQYKINTYIAGLMEFSNTLARAAAGPEWDEACDTLLLLMAPGVPHIAEELWQRTGHIGSIHSQPWPAGAAITSSHATLAVQVNGKLRDRITVAAHAPQAAVEQAARVSARVAPHLQGKAARVVYVPGRLINFVVINSVDEQDILEEYDFSNGVRGKYFAAYNSPNDGDSG